MIVDDSIAFLAAAQRLLERQGFTVVGVASNGDDAIRKLQELRPDVVLVDIDLGGESGLEVAQRLDGRAGTASTPIVLISTHAEEDYRDLIAESPAIGFVPKAELSARAIEDLLGRAPNATQGT